MLKLTAITPAGFISTTSGRKLEMNCALMVRYSPKISLLRVDASEIVHEGLCNSTTDVCQEATTRCIADKTGDYRCLCNSTTYYKRSTGKCSSLNDLKVSVLSIARSPHTVIFRWAAPSTELTVIYEVQWTPPGGDVDYINNNGSQVSGLTPATNYSFSIFSLLKGNEYNTEKSAAVNISFSTNAIGYGNLCNEQEGSNVCEDQNTACITALSSQQRCLCTANYYRNTANAACVALSELEVLNFTTRSNTTLMTLSWRPNKQGVPVKYTIYPIPGQAQVGPLTDTAGTVSNLTPGTLYSLTITFTLPATGYYPEKNISSTTTTVWTKPASPGTVTSVVLSPETPVYDVTFAPSQGNVFFYTMKVNNESGQASGVLTRFRFKTLLPGRSYAYTIVAYNGHNESSVPIEGTLETSTLAPGTVRNFTVEQDDKEAREMTITFVCPDREDSTGHVTAYVIRKTLLNPAGGLQSEHLEYTVSSVNSSPSCRQTYTADDVGGIIVGRNYTFAVRAKTQNFNGSFSEEVHLYVAPKVPHLSQTLVIHGVSSLVRNPDNPKSQKTSLDVVVCAPCLLDDRQGEVTKLGLIVCIEGDNKRCGDQGRKERSQLEFGDFKNWREARASGFRDVHVYRATPDYWGLTLQGQTANYPYTIGNDNNCEQLSKTDYCNGPVPRDMPFRISVIKCNVAGCAMGSYEGPFNTGDDEDGTDHVLIIGVAVAAAVVLIVVVTIVIGVVVYRRRSRRAQGQEVDLYSTLDFTRKDDHQYQDIRGALGSSHSSSQGNKAPGSDVTDRVSMAGLSVNTGLYSDVNDVGSSDSGYVIPGASSYDFITYSNPVFKPNF